jgi:V/A-type H+/Na+-transporting ATPase subunit I
MISPMVNFTFLVFHAQYEKFLEDLQGMGTVHVKARPVESLQKGLPGLEEDYKAISGAVNDLNKREVKVRTSKSPLSWEKILEEYNACNRNIAEFDREKKELEITAVHVSVWGEFSLNSINKLEKSGIPIGFFRIKENKFDKGWLEKYPIEIINHIGSSIYFVYFGADQELLPHVHKLEHPTAEGAEINKRMAELEKKISQNQEKLNELAESGIPVLNEKLQEFGTKIDFLKVLNDHTLSHGEGKVKVLEGWVPETEQQRLIEYLDVNGILYTSQYATGEPDTPVQLVNSKFGTLFEPIGKLFSLPSYMELDLTIYFAPFFLLFFGFCLGDGGYGIVMFLAATIYKRKASADMKPYMTLVQYFGLSTLVMGIIFGNFFGVELGKLAFLSSLKPYFLDSNKVFYLSLILGGIQILFGLCLKIINQIKKDGFIYGLGTIGWLILIFNLLGFSIFANVSGPLSPAFELIKKGITIAAFLLILFYTDPGLKIHLRFFSGLWGIYNTVMGIFGDMLSYIRLFALGISSSILGMVVNQMALSFSEIKFIGPVVFILVVVVGHTANLAISSLSSFVHPLRLTLVEFYKNAGFTGGGRQYNPFSKYKSI